MVKFLLIFQILRISGSLPIRNWNFPNILDKQKYPYFLAPPTIYMSEYAPGGNNEAKLCSSRNDGTSQHRGARGKLRQHLQTGAERSHLSRKKYLIFKYYNFI